jgi:replicative DNA helicase Mcm
MNYLIDASKVEWWNNVLDETLRGEYETAILSETPFHLDFWKISKSHHELSEYILQEPISAFFHLNVALKKNGSVIPNTSLSFNSEFLVDKSLSELKTDSLNKLTSIECFVVAADSPKPRIVIAALQCRKCANVVKIAQNKDTEILCEPFECSEELGGCGRATTWDLLPHISIYKDFQKILVQNPFHETKRVKLEAHLYDCKAGLVVPGDTVTLHGVYLMKDIVKNNKKIQNPDPYFLVKGIEQSKYISLSFTEDEKKLAEDLSKSGELWSILINNFAPSIFGNVCLKEALLLQLFGGVWHDLQDGTSRRGSIHLLVVGEPSTAKSQLNSAASAISPRFTKASGRDATRAGLTAGAGRDELGSGDSFTLQAGALVLADGGICFLDEFDKMPDDVHGALHDPMERGLVLSSKMGSVNQSLPARTGILATMNPIYGRFDDHMSFLEQIKLDSALVSRFDLIFALKDTPNEKNDWALAKHMYRSLKNNIQNKDNKITTDFLRKYVFHAKQLKPLISEKIDDLISERYVQYRKQIETKIQNITPRHKEAIRRLSEASAKSRFSTEVTMVDVERAWRVFEGSLNSLGEYNLDVLSVGWDVNSRQLSRDIGAVLPCSYQQLRGLGFFEDDINRLVSLNFIKEGKDNRFYLTKQRSKNDEK